MPRRAAQVAQQVFNEHGKRVQYKIGTMIEVPRPTLCPTLPMDPGPI